MFGGYRKPDNFVENINPHEEYFAFDITKAIAIPITALYRKIMDSSVKTIENPGYLVFLFLDKKSIVLDTVNNIINLFGWPIGTATSIYDYFSSSKNLVDIKPNDNVWYKIVIDYKNVKYDFIEDYKKLFEINKKVLTYAIGENGICKPCRPKKLTTGDKSDLKLFKPDKIGVDFSKAYGYMLKNLNYDKAKKEEWDKLYHDVVEFFGSIASHLERNIRPIETDITDDYRNH